ncbi:MAG TPA: hypothetical protein V6C52_09770 [Coleofasciculaceae cyanobacterium]|jgi:hypothetical protein
MATTYHALTTFNVNELENLPEYEGTSQRFLEGFPPFVMLKKEQAVRTLLKEEIPNETLVKNPDFIAAIANRVVDEALVEKRYIFLSLNPVVPA